MADPPLRPNVLSKCGRPVYGGELPEGWDSGEAVLRGGANRAGRP